MTTATDVLNEAVAAFESVTPAEWANGIQALLKDVQAKGNLENTAADVVKALDPALTPAVTLVQLYLALGGQPAQVGGLQQQRTDGNSMDRDV